MTLLIATPVRGAELGAATVALGYAEQRAALMSIMPAQGRIVFSLDVVRARNRAAAQVLTEPGLAGVTHVLWWDDDEWPADVRIVRNMMDFDLPLVGAAYTRKRRPTRWVHQEWADGSVPDERGLLDVRSVGMGFTLTSRACLEAMAKDAEWYWDAPTPRECPNLFGQLYDDMDGRRVLLSEDFSFCKRWRENHGGKVYAYDVEMFHAGSHAWSVADMRLDAELTKLRALVPKLELELTELRAREETR
jgi:hypothetical protein